jgi:hypothetical protein
MTSATSITIPIKIGIEENINESNTDSLYGQNKYNMSSAKATITLEYDAMYESTINTLNYYLDDRKYEKKLFVNEPYSLTKLQDFYSRLYSEKVRLNTSATNTKDVTPVGTEIASADYTKLGTINTTYYYVSAGLAYKTLYFTFDLTDYLALYDVSTIDRLTLMLHNPYVTKPSWLPGNNDYAGYTISAFDTINARWTEIGR